MFLALFWGVLECVSSALMTLLQEQLRITTQQLSLIHTTRGVAYICSAIIASLVVDKFKSTHHYIATVSIIASISLCLIPSSQDRGIQTYHWIVIGYSLATIEVLIPVYTFRAWPGNAQHAWFIFLSIQAASKTLVPIIVQFTVQRVGDYSYALYAVSMSAVIFAGLAVCIQTPLHDELRSVQAAMHRMNSQRSIHQVFSLLMHDFQSTFT